MTADIPVAAPARKRGRPTKLTPETTAALIAAIERGHTLEQAARRASIHPSTLRRWSADAGARAFRADFARARARGAQKSAGPVLEDRAGVLVLVLTRRHRNGLLEVDERFARPGTRWAERLLRRRDLPDLLTRSGLDLSHVSRRLKPVPPGLHRTAA